MNKNFWSWSLAGVIISAVVIWMGIIEITRGVELNTLSSALAYLVGLMAVCGGTAYWQYRLWQAVGLDEKPAMSTLSEYSSKWLLSQLSVWDLTATILIWFFSFMVGTNLTPILAIFIGAQLFTTILDRMMQLNMAGYQLTLTKSMYSEGVYKWFLAETKTRRSLLTISQYLGGAVLFFAIVAAGLTLSGSLAQTPTFILLATVGKSMISVIRGYSSLRFTHELSLAW